MPHNSLSPDAIFKTVLYSDLFDFPLTKDELWLYLLTDKPVAKDVFAAAVVSEKRLIRTGSYFSLSKKGEANAKRRKDWRNEQKKKVGIARSVARKIAYIPSVYFIGVSGGVAAGRADGEDDIDLFIITKEGTLWLTRFIVTCLVTVLGKRRKRLQKETKNKICLNMFLSEGKLRFAKKRQEIYTAHEIVFLLPLIERNDIYHKFIQENQWVERYLYNAYGLCRKCDVPKAPENTVLLWIWKSFISRFSFIERFARILQMWYMKKHTTHEIIGDGMLGFHPLDYRKIIVTAYARKTKK